MARKLILIYTKVTASRPSIQVHQTLHGYADGHSLIASSLRLSHDASRILLQLSDMSGPTMISGFEDYLTAYPIPEIDKYAFARTWYAPEMRRPGCVWTHTFLIDWKDLQQIRDIRIFLDFFERPHKKPEKHRYQNALELKLDAHYLRVAGDRDILASTLEQTIVRLYGYPDEQVFLLSKKSFQMEQIPLVIWNQQWPALRRSFAFCTGSLSNRQYNGRFLDLQIVPTELTSQLRRDVPAHAFISALNPDNSGRKLNWVKSAMQDLVAENNVALRDFMWLVGGGLNDRSAFPKVVEVFLAATENDLDSSLGKVIRILTHNFPGRDEATALKGAVLGPPGQRAGTLRNIDEGELLQALCSTAEYGSLAARSLDVRPRAAELTRKSPDNAQLAASNILNSNYNPLGEEYLAGYAEAIGLQEAIRFSHQHPGILPLFLRGNPSFATSPQLWVGSMDAQRELFDAVASEITPSEMASIVYAMLQARSDAIANELVKKFGGEVVLAILGAISSDESLLQFLRSSAWLNAMRPEVDLLVNWLSTSSSSSPVVSGLVASLLDPHSPQVLELGSSPWLELASVAESKLDTELLSDVMTFLLALAFHNTDSSSHELTIPAFSNVHDVAFRDQLGYSRWLLLRDSLPSLPLWRDWDKCERLRRGLIDHFQRNAWPIKTFLAATERGDIFDKIMNSGRAIPEMRSYLVAIRDAVMSGTVAATDWQRKVLRDL